MFNEKSLIFHIPLLKTPIDRKLQCFGNLFFFFFVVFFFRWWCLVGKRTSDYALASAFILLSSLSFMMSQTLSSKQQLLKSLLK